MAVSDVPKASATPIKTLSVVTHVQSRLHLPTLLSKRIDARSRGSASMSALAPVEPSSSLQPGLNALRSG